MSFQKPLKKQVAKSSKLIETCTENKKLLMWFRFLKELKNKDFCHVITKTKFQIRHVFFFQHKETRYPLVSEIWGKYYEKQKNVLGKTNIDGK